MVPWVNEKDVEYDGGWIKIILSKSSKLGSDLLAYLNEWMDEWMNDIYLLETSSA